MNKPLDQCKKWLTRAAHKQGGHFCGTKTLFQIPPLDFSNTMSKTHGPKSPQRVLESLFQKNQITSHHITSHRITLRWIASHCIALHYRHGYIRTYVDDDDDDGDDDDDDDDDGDDDDVDDDVDDDGGDDDKDDGVDDDEH